MSVSPLLLILGLTLPGPAISERTRDTSSDSLETAYTPVRLQPMAHSADSKYQNRPDLYGPDKL